MISRQGYYMERHKIDSPNPSAEFVVGAVASMLFQVGYNTSNAAHAAEKVSDGTITTRVVYDPAYLSDVLVITWENK